VDRSLREALATTSGRTRIGVINTLGVRRSVDAVAALRPLALGSQPQEASAALFALAKIANPAAVDVLSQAQTQANGEAKAAAAEAWLQAANRMAAGGNAAGAVPIYRKLYASSAPATVRAAALHGLGLAGGAQAVPTLMEALHGSDGRLQLVAAGALIPGSSTQLMAEMPS